MHDVFLNWLNMNSGEVKCSYKYNEVIAMSLLSFDTRVYRWMWTIECIFTKCILSSLDDWRTMRFTRQMLPSPECVSSFYQLQLNTDYTTSNFNISWILCCFINNHGFLFKKNTVLGKFSTENFLIIVEYLL